MFDTFNPIFLIFASYGLGVITTELVKAIDCYKWFQNHNYISDQLTRQLGVLKFGWLIRHSFMGKFNQKLKMVGKSKTTLEKFKEEMTYAEINHLFGFVSLLILNLLFILWEKPSWQIILLFVLNITFNLYLVFLQQYNKRRINRILQ